MWWSRRRGRRLLRPGVGDQVPAASESGASDPPTDEADTAGGEGQVRAVTPAGPPIGQADPGRQPERTRFAWRRTTLAATACALLLTRLGANLPPRPWVVACVGAGLLWWTGMLAITHRRVLAMTHARPEAVARLLTVVALGCVYFAGLAIVLILAKD